MLISICSIFYWINYNFTITAEKLSTTTKTSTKTKIRSQDVYNSLPPISHSKACSTSLPTIHQLQSMYTMDYDIALALIEFSTFHRSVLCDAGSTILLM